MSSKQVVTGAYDEAIAKFINGVIDTADKVGQFAMAELPGFITEVLQWYFTYNLIMFISGVLVAIVLIVLDWKLFQFAKECDKSDYDHTATLLGWGLVGTIVRVPLWFGGVGTLLNLQWLKIWIAPKLWLIEYAAGLAK
jgi:hypothetical protein